MTPTQPNTLRRWEILRRDDFTCAFCGSRPGNEELEVDHMYPESVGGSGHDNNLITSCYRCNRGKSDRVAIPRSWCEKTPDRDGWIIWKRWGNWTIKWNPVSDPDASALSEIVVACDAYPFGDGEYWFELDRVRESDWYEHIKLKSWATPEVLADLCCVLDFAETLVCVSSVV